MRKNIVLYCTEDKEIEKATNILSIFFSHDPVRDITQSASLQTEHVLLCICSMHKIIFTVLFMSSIG